MMNSKIIFKDKEFEKSMRIRLIKQEGEEIFEEELLNIDVLTFVEDKIKNLEDLVYLKNLKFLYIKDCTHIRDYSSIKNIKLKYLIIDNSTITSLDFLKNYTSLEKLDIRGNKNLNITIEDFDKIMDNNPKLKIQRFDLENTPIQKVLSEKNIIVDNKNEELIRKVFGIPQEKNISEFYVKYESNIMINTEWNAEQLKDIISKAKLLKNIVVNDHYMDMKKYKYLKQLQNEGYTITINNDVEVTYSIGKWFKAEKKLESIINGVNKEWTDFKKIIYVYEKLRDIKYNHQSSEIVNSYNSKENRNLLDKILLTNDPVYTNSTTMYGLLVENNAICSGYAIGLRNILYRLGIESYIAKNKDHVCNIVKADGKYTCCDVTNDAGLKDRGTLRPMLFGKSIEKLSNIYIKHQRTPIDKIVGLSEEEHQRIMNNTVDIDEYKIEKAYKEIKQQLEKEEPKELEDQRKNLEFEKASLNVELNLLKNQNNIYDLEKKIKLLENNLTPQFVQWCKDINYDENFMKNIGKSFKDDYKTINSIKKSSNYYRERVDSIYEKYISEGENVTRKLEDVQVSSDKFNQECENSIVKSKKKEKVIKEFSLATAYMKYKEIKSTYDINGNKKEIDEIKSTEKGMLKKLWLKITGKKSLNNIKINLLEDRNNMIKKSMEFIDVPTNMDIEYIVNNISEEKLKVLKKHENQLIDEDSLNYIKQISCLKNIIYKNIKLFENVVIKPKKQEEIKKDIDQRNEQKDTLRQNKIFISKSERIKRQNSLIEENKNWLKENEYTVSKENVKSQYMGIGRSQDTTLQVILNEKEKNICNVIVSKSLVKISRKINKDIVKIVDVQEECDKEASTNKKMLLEV